MSAADISPKAVEYLASKFDGSPNDYRWERDHHAAAATLRALSARVAELERELTVEVLQAEQAEIAHDAARAEVARLREALERLLRNRNAPASLADAFVKALAALAAKEPQP